MVFAVFVFFGLTVRADMPPEDGMVRVSSDLIVQTGEDLSDFRFFLDFYGDLREIEVKNKDRTVISPMGGGARYSAGMLIAVPKTSLKDFEGRLTPERLNALSQAIKTNKIENPVELTQHRFVSDIPKGEKPVREYYSITREGKTLKAERKSDEPPKVLEDSVLFPKPSPWKYIIAGVLLTIAALVIGFLLFRRAKN